MEKQTTEPVEGEVGLDGEKKLSKNEQKRLDKVKRLAAEKTEK